MPPNIKSSVSRRSEGNAYWRASLKYQRHLDAILKEADAIASNALKFLEYRA
jgi:hypothetical protein